jgi:hypothetical protein
MSDLTPGPALECEFCGATTPCTPEDAAEGMCLMCDESAIVVTLVACPAPDPEQCEDETHDYGTGFHHEPVAR